MIGGVDIPRHNGIQVLNEQKSKNEWYRVLANAYLTIKLLEGLEYKLSLSGDIRYSNDYLKLTKDHPYGSPKGEITDYRSMMQNYLIDNTLTYTKQIKDFNFTALEGTPCKKSTQMPVLLSARTSRLHNLTTSTRQVESTALLPPEERIDSSLPSSD